jgi:hypothetical protein
MKQSIKVAAVVIATAATGVAAWTPASASSGLTVVDVPNANPRFGVADNILTPTASEVAVAWGSMPLTNPDTANGVTRYGYTTSDAGPLTQDQHEADKSEPDKNVYLVFGGRHYLYQGHEGGPRGYVTRVNLDETDPAKRVTLIADARADGTSFPTVDGITWDPFTHQLLLTAESGAPRGGVLAVELDAAGDPTTGVAEPLPALGSGGYEGIQNDKDGNVWLVEDIGGAKASGGKVPNSYVYRFVPADRTDLTAGGRLQALQVKRRGGMPVGAAELSANPADPFVSDLHRYGTSFRTAWVTVHNGTDAFAATAAAATAGATPMKRPENGVFRPGTGFREFYFTETGDTDTASTLPGRFGGIFKLAQSSPSATTGTLSMVLAGDVRHTGFDNIAFATADDILVVEDAGDTLHQERGALDSGYVVGLSGDHGHHAKGRAPRVTRFLAEGRDASALYDATTSPGYNDGDNEITGIHVSDGDPTARGLLGAKVPRPLGSTWRTFWTQQHGDNVTWEVTWSGRRPALTPR